MVPKSAKHLIYFKHERPFGQQNKQQLTSISPTEDLKLAN